jgi:hypothetical protein
VAAIIALTQKAHTAGFALPEGNSLYYDRRMAQIDASFWSSILGFIREISVPTFLAFLGWIFSQSLAKQSAELQKSLAKQSSELQESLARQSAELQRATTQQSIGKDYVGIAVSIFEKPKDE